MNVKKKIKIQQHRKGSLNSKDHFLWYPNKVVNTPSLSFMISAKHFILQLPSFENKTKNKKKPNN